MEDIRFSLVDGRRNGAIYDFESGKVYSINKTGVEIIHRYLDGEQLTMEESRFVEELSSIGVDKNSLQEDRKVEYPSAESKVSLRYIWLELTEKCNCNCIHCYGQWGGEEKNKHVSLGKDYWFKVIDEVYQHGGRNIQLIGGEPLIHPNFAEILRYAHLKGMEQIDVFTNATLIDEAMARLLKDNCASVRVSLYGHCPEVHDMVTKHNGSFKKTDRGLELLKEYSIPTRIAVILMDVNENNIEEIKLYIESKGHKYGGYDTIRQAYGGNQISHCVDRLDILETKYQKEPKFKTKRDTFKVNHYINTCWNNKLAFAANGDVFPCIFARNCRLGNLLNNSFDEILLAAKTPWNLNIDMVDGCKDCEFRYACRDCRPLAESLTGNIYGKYPRCTYSPENGIWNDVESITVELKSKP